MVLLSVFDPSDIRNLKKLFKPPFQNMLQQLQTYDNPGLNRSTLTNAVARSDVYGSNED